MVTIEEAINNPLENLGKDIRMVGNDIQFSVQNDFDIVKYKNNLAQAIRNKLQTTLSEMLLHQDYGSKLKLLIGSKQTEVLKVEIKNDIESTMLQEPRVLEVQNFIIEFDSIIPQKINVKFDIQPIENIEPFNMVYELFV